MAGTTTYFGISYPQSTDLVKDGAANMQTIATGFDSAVAIPTYNNQTGTTYTFALSDIGKTVTASNASASTYTIPPTASVTWPSNATLKVVNLGAGVVTFAAGAGVTVTNATSTIAQYQVAELIRTGLNAWTVVPLGSASGLTLISTITLSGTSITISNCFTSTYTNYLVVSNNTVANGGVSDLIYQMRASGTTATTGYQNSVIFNTNTAGPSRFYASGSGFIAGATADIGHGTTVNIYGPQLAGRTTLAGSSSGWGSVNGQQSSVFGLLNNTTQYDSLVISNPSTMSGTLSIYGYGK